MTDPDEKKGAHDPTMSTRSALAPKIPIETSQNNVSIEGSSALLKGDKQRPETKDEPAGEKLQENQLPGIYWAFDPHPPLRLDDLRPDLALDKQMLRDIQTPIFWQTKLIRRQRVQVMTPDGPADMESETTARRWGISGVHWKWIGATSKEITEHFGRRRKFGSDGR